MLCGFSDVYWVLPSFTGFQCVLPSLRRLYWVLLGFNRVLLIITRFLTDYTECNQDLLGFTEFYRVSPGFT